MPEKKGYLAQIDYNTIKHKKTQKKHKIKSNYVKRKQSDFNW